MCGGVEWGHLRILFLVFVSLWRKWALSLGTISTNGALCTKLQYFLTFILLPIASGIRRMRAVHDMPQCLPAKPMILITKPASGEFAILEIRCNGNKSFICYLRSHFALLSNHGQGLEHDRFIHVKLSSNVPFTRERARPISKCGARSILK